MRKSLYFAALGLVLMVAGTVTTFVAFGQSEVEDAAPEATEDVSAMPTSTPFVEPVVEAPPVVENAQPVEPPTTVPTPVPAATMEPPTAVPTEVPVEPTAETVPAEPVVDEVPVEPTAETIPAEPVVEAAPVEPTADTVPVEGAESEAPVEPTADTVPVEPVVEAAPVEPTAETIPAEPVVEEAPAEPTDIPVEETIAEDGEPTPVTEAVEPVVEPTAADTVPTEEKPQSSDTDANAPQEQGFSDPSAIDPPGTTPLPPHRDEEPLLEPTAITEEQPAVVEVAATPENALPVEPVVMPEGEIEPTLEPTAAVEAAVDAEALEAVVAFSLVSGQVNKTNRVGKINLLLTLPDGTTLETITDEGGNFAFETLLPGDYNLIASAPGFLARTLNFTLVEGETLALPVTALNAGDLNQDNQIDLSDVVLIAANYNGPAVVAEADLNGDEWIDISDLTIIGARFGLSGPVAWE